MRRSRHFFELITSKSRVLAQFFAAQGITMAGNLLYGLLCVRLLPASEYAKFVVLFGVQGTLIVLMDINFSGTLVPLIGERVDNHQLIADYVASLRKLAQWIYALIAVAAVVAYPLLVRNRGWSWRTVAAMVVILLVSTWFMRVSAAYGTVLILLRDRAYWYRGQMISSLGTLALLGAFWAFGVLSGFVAILLNVAGIVFIGISYHFRAQRLLGVPGYESVEKRRSIVKLALPNVPQSLLYAFQGQISLFLIIYFGHASGVASVGALSRLGQIFALASQMNPLLIEPYFAKLSRDRLKNSYGLVLLLAVIACGVVTLAAAQVPEVFLWLLGPQYKGLRTEVLISIATAAIGCLSGIMWAIHSARRFVYWWSNTVRLVLTLLLQVLFVTRLDLSTVRSVLWLNLVTTVASLSVNVMIGIYGFIRGPREVESGPREKSDTSIEANAYLDQVESADFGVPEPKHHQTADDHL